MVNFYFIILWLGLSYAAAAELTVANLYEAHVPVNGSEEENRALAMQQALGQVLVKLSGNSTLLDNPKVQKKLAQAEQFAEQFEYQTQEGQLQLIVEFDADAVKKLLQNLGLTQWSNARPTLLTWIVIDAEDKQTVINQAERPGEAVLLNSQATERGLPLLFPILDLEDLRTLKVTDIIVGRREAIHQVAKRYGVKTIMVGRVISQENEWEGQWHLLVGNEQLSWETRQPQLNKLLIKGLQETIDKIAKRSVSFENAPPAAHEDGLTLRTSTEETFAIQVNGVSHLESFAQVREYLESLDIVTDLQVQRMQANQVTFQITVKGGTSALSQALSLGHLLTPDSEPNSDIKIVYRFTASPW